MSDTTDTALETERLVLRGWREDDVDPFVAMCQDPLVMRHFPGLATRAQCVDLVVRHREGHAAGAPALLAVEVTDTRSFIGFVGLARPSFTTSFTPCVEIGWRLAASAWGHGYATEGALAVLEHGFTTLGLTEIVSFTSHQNVPSQRVMQRIGMHRSPAEDFEHPNVPEGHPVRPHLLYRLTRDEWLSSSRAVEARDQGHRGGHPTAGLA